MAKSSSYARGHKETSKTGKWDPGGYNLDSMRADLTDKLAGGSEPPEPAPMEEQMPVLWASDGSGPDPTIYAIPLDLSYKVPVDKPSYDAINAAVKNAGFGTKGTWVYIRVDISAAQLAAIPLLQTEAVYLTADGDPGTYLAPSDLSSKIWVTDGTSKNALDQTKITGKGRYDEVKVTLNMLDNIPTVGRKPARP